MKTLTTIFLILTSLFTYGQRGTDWIPFKVKLVDSKDTLINGFEFYLTSGDKQFRPTKNDSLNCFQFQNIDSLVDFHLIYKNNHYKLKGIETVRLMYDCEWTFTPDSNATDTCYRIVADHAGCFVNVYLGPYPIPACDKSNYVWLTSFLPRQESVIQTIEPRKNKKTKRRQK